MHASQGEQIHSRSIFNWLLLIGKEKIENYVIFIAKREDYIIVCAPKWVFYELHLLRVSKVVETSAGAFQDREWHNEPILDFVARRAFAILPAKI